MPTTVVETFYPVDISNVAVKFNDASEAVSFGCTGVLSAETEMRVVAAKCGAETVKEASKPIKMTGTISGHAKVSILREVFGLSNEGLKPGIYSYGLDSKGKSFTLTADVVDDFDNVTKIIAFPLVANSSGFKFSIDKSSDEVAPVELEFTCTPDQARKFYYEGFVDEIDDEDVIEKWRTAFDYSLVQKTMPPETRTLKVTEKENNK